MKEDSLVTTISNLSKIIDLLDLTKLGWNDVSLELMNNLSILPNFIYDNNLLFKKGQGLLNIHPFYLCKLINNINQNDVKKDLINLLKDSFNQVDFALWIKINNYNLKNCKNEYYFRNTDLQKLIVIDKWLNTKLQTFFFNTINKLTQSASIFYKFIDDRILNNLKQYELFNKSYTFKDFVSDKDILCRHFCYGYDIIVNNEIIFKENSSKLDGLINDIKNQFIQPIINVKYYDHIKDYQDDFNKEMIKYTNLMFEKIANATKVVTTFINIFKDVLLAQFMTKTGLTKFYQDALKILHLENWFTDNSKNLENKMKKYACTMFCEILLLDNKDFINLFNKKCFNSKTQNIVELKKLISTGYFSANKIFYKYSYKQLLVEDICKLKEVAKSNDSLDKMKDFMMTLFNIHATLLHLFIMNIIPIANKNEHQWKK